MRDESAIHNPRRAPAKFLRVIVPTGLLLASLLFVTVTVPYGAYALPSDDTTTSPEGVAPQVPAFAEGSHVAIYQNYIPWFRAEEKNEKALASLGLVQGVDFAVRPMSDLKTGIPPETQIVIIVSASLGNNLNQIADQVDPAAQTNLDAFVRGGGVLVAHLGDNNIGFPTAYQVPGLLGTADDIGSCTGLTIVDPNHPLVLGPDGIAGTFDDLDNNKIDARKQPVPSAAGDPFAPGGPFCSDNHGSLAGILPPGAQIVLREEAGAQRPVWAQYTHGSGHVIATTLTLEFFRHQFQTLVNEMHVALQKVLDVQIVDIDIKPGSDPNSINCENPREAIAVAILTTDDFDATAVNHTTVAFGPDGATEIHSNVQGVKRHEEDVDGDGDIDLVLHFRFGDTGLACDSTEATLTGSTFDGQAIEGTDSVRMVPPG